MRAREAEEDRKKGVEKIDGVVYVERKKREAKEDDRREKIKKR